MLFWGIVKESFFRLFWNLFHFGNSFIKCLHCSSSGCLPEQHCQVGVFELLMEVFSEMAQAVTVWRAWKDSVNCFDKALLSIRKEGEFLHSEFAIWGDTLGSRNLGADCSRTRQRSSNIHSQLSLFSASTTANATGNSFPSASIPMAARRIPWYLVLRWVPSRPRTGRQWENPIAFAPKQIKTRLNRFSVVDSMVARLLGFVYSISAMYWGIAL